jgi:hypothetical protein
MNHFIQKMNLQRAENYLISKVIPFFGRLDNINWTREKKQKKTDTH